MHTTLTTTKFQKRSAMIIVRLAVIAAILLLLELFCWLAKEHIVKAALLLAALHNTRAQQRRTEKLEDEYAGQRAINLAAKVRHKTAYLALQNNFHSISNETTPCTRAHYEDPSADMVFENRHLKDRLHQLRLSGKTSTCTRAHHDRSTAEMTCANRVLIDSTRKLRATASGLKSEVDRKKKAVNSLMRALETLQTTSTEEARDKDAAIKDLQRALETLQTARETEVMGKNTAIKQLQRSVENAMALHSGCSKEVHQLRAAADEAKNSARELERQLQSLQARERSSAEQKACEAASSSGAANGTAEDVGQQKKESEVLQEGVNQSKWATVEDDDEDEL